MIGVNQYISLSAHMVMIGVNQHISSTWYTYGYDWC